MSIYSYSNSDNILNLEIKQLEYCELKGKTFFTKKKYYTNLANELSIV